MAERDFLIRHLSGTPSPLNSTYKISFVLSKAISVPYRLTEKSELRMFLNSDRERSLFALADLNEMFDYCDGWALEDSSPGRLIWPRTKPIPVTI